MALSKDEKYDLANSVKSMLTKGESVEYIVERLEASGFKKSTIKKYIRIFSR